MALFDRLLGLVLGELEDAREPKPELEAGTWVKQGACQIAGPELYATVIGPAQGCGDGWYELQPRFYVSQFTGERLPANDERVFVQHRDLLLEVEDPE